jgi:hypothetical protein
MHIYIRPYRPGGDNGPLSVGNVQKAENPLIDRDIVRAPESPAG